MSDLIERLRAATMGFDWSDLPDDALIPAVPLLREAADRIASLEAERDDARQQRDEIGRAWDEADARAKEAEALVARMEKALAEARAQRDYWRGRYKAGCEIEAELLAELERIASPGTIAGMHEQDRASKLQAIAAASLSSSKQKDDE